MKYINISKAPEIRPKYPIQCHFAQKSLLQWLSCGSVSWGLHPGVILSFISCFVLFFFSHLQESFPLLKRPQ